MKKVSGIAVFLLCIHIASAQDDSLQQLLETASFFRLNTALSSPSNHSNTATRLYYEAFADNAFNRNHLSIKRIDSFMNSKGSTWPGRAIADVLAVQMDNYGKTYQYLQAANTGNLILEKYAPELDGEYVQDLANTLKIWKTLSLTPPQTIEQHDDASVNITQGTAKIRTIRVSSSGEEEDFIFDTGANISTISESTADKMKVRRLHTAINVSSIQGATIVSDIGVADSLSIGSMKFRNVVFLVMPDAALIVGAIHYTIKGIIGYPVISAMREIHITKDGMLKVPMTMSNNNIHNLAMDGLTPMIWMTVNGKDTLNFHFDTGAQSSDLYSPYYDRYREEVSKQRRIKTKQAGVGGSRKMKVYQLDQFNMVIGGRQATLPHISVITAPITPSKKLIYGNIGQDVIGCFNEMIINFDSMFLTFN